MVQENIPIQQAIQRLEKALMALNNVLRNRNETNADLSELKEEIQRMNADRSRLAQELDNSESRSERLEQANKEVSRRLITAMETIRIIAER